MINKKDLQVMFDENVFNEFMRLKALYQRRYESLEENMLYKETTKEFIDTVDNIKRIYTKGIR